MSEQPFRPEDGGELRPDALDVEQHRRRRWRLLRGKQHVPLGLHRLDLLEQQFEPIELPADLSLEMLWQGTAIARPQLVEPLPSIAAKRLVALGDGLAQQLDGAGSAVTTTQCLMHPNRNPSMTKAEISETIAAELGLGEPLISWHTARIRPADIASALGRRSVVLVGMMGAGKSSILKAIAGLIPAEGQMSFAGEDLAID